MKHSETLTVGSKDKLQQQNFNELIVGRLARTAVKIGCLGVIGFLLWAVDLLTVGILCLSLYVSFHCGLIVGGQKERKRQQILQNLQEQALAQKQLVIKLSDIRIEDIIEGRSFRGQNRTQIILPVRQSSERK